MGKEIKIKNSSVLMRRFFKVLMFLVSVFILFCLNPSFNNEGKTEWAKGLNIVSAQLGPGEPAEFDDLDPSSHPALTSRGLTPSGISEEFREKNDPCGLSPGCWFKMLLYGVFSIISWLLVVAVTLFSWVIEPANVYRVLDNSAIYESWKMVRDFLNLSFILVLLFSAFCTIFQVEKYNLKKILLTLVIMALLVNFSFPVARFIIDASNVTFYFVINSSFLGGSGQSILAKFADYTSIVGILTPAGIKTAEFSYIIAIIIFTFILMITLLVLALLFIIRLIVLGILIILAPAGFVAAIFPSTKHYADDWWGSLFKYSFFAPIMALAIVISLNVLATMKNGGIGSSFLKEAGVSVENKAVSASFIGDMAFFAIPIVMIWVGMMAATKLSGAAGDWVAGQAKKFAGWARRQPWRGTKALVGATGVSGGVKQTYEYYRKKGIPIAGRRWFGTEQREEREAGVASRLGVTGAREEFYRKKVQEIRDEFKKQGGLPEQQLKDIITGKIKKDKFTQQAAAIELADKYNFFGPDAWKNYNAAKNLVKGDKALDSMFDKEVKEKRADLVMRYKVENKIEGATYKGEFDKLSVSDFGKMLFDDLYEASDDAKQAIHNYFDATKPVKKLEISKNLSGKNQAFLESKGIYFETEGGTGEQKSSLFDQFGRPIK